MYLIVSSFLESELPRIESSSTARRETTKDHVIVIMPIRVDTYGPVGPVAGHLHIRTRKQKDCH